MAMRSDFAARARALVGTPFRPQGRSAEGLDCVGLVLSTFDIPAREVRRDYRLRGDHRGEMGREIERYFRPVPKRDARAGDVLLLQVAADQLHLGVQTGRGFIHADIGIGRVVETPGAPPWPVLKVYRKRVRARSN